MCHNKRECGLQPEVVLLQSSFSSLVSLNLHFSCLFFPLAAMAGLKEMIFSCAGGVSADGLIVPMAVWESREGFLTCLMM